MNISDKLKSLAIDRTAIRASGGGWKTIAIVAAVVAAIALGWVLVGRGGEATGLAGMSRQLLQRWSA